MTTTTVKVSVGVLAGCALGLLLTATGALERIGLQPRSWPISSSGGGTGDPPLPDLGVDPDRVVEPEAGHSRFARLAKQAAPGVVKVHTSKTVVRRLPGVWFPDVFGRPFGGVRPAPQQEYRVPSLGTGFIISSDGFIVTNNHVVDEVDTIDVSFSDGSQAPAQIVGQDPKTDLALIRVEGRTDLHALPLGDSDAILPGDWVIAIGNPFGLEHTVTVGIVSAKGRDIGQGPYDDYIQTDAAINPGNSGGPLLDAAGRVIGINSAVSRGANTIGFAVPINLAKEIVPQLQAQGHVTRGFLGVTAQPLTPELTAAFGLESSDGALVAQVTPGGPAEEAGIRRGDVIVGYRGEAIQKLLDLLRAVSRTPVGERVDVEVIRDRRRQSFEARIAEAETLVRGTRVADTSGPEAFGLQVEDPSPELRRRLRLGPRGGVTVAAVEPGGPAAEAGMQPGDLLLELNHEPIRNAVDLRNRLSGSSPRALFLVLRGRMTVYIPVVRPPS
jgi:serine protease Do